MKYKECITCKGIGAIKVKGESLWCPSCNGDGELIDRDTNKEEEITLL